MTSRTLLDDYGQIDNEAPSWKQVVSRANRDVQFMKTAKQPGSLVDIYAKDPRFAGSADAMERQNERFIDTAERFWYENRGQAPLEWLYQQDTDDLELLRGLNRTGGRALGTAVEDIIYEREAEAAHREFQATLDAEVDRKVESYNRNYTLGRWLSKLPQLVGVEQIAKLFGTDINAALAAYEGASGEDIRKAADKAVRDQYLRGIQPQEQQSWINAGMDFINTGVGGSIENAAWLFDNVGTGLWFNKLMPLLSDGYTAEQRRAIEQVQQEDAVSDQQMMRSLQNMTHEVAWDELQRVNPQEHQMWVDMAGGDLFRAFGLFAGGHQDFKEVEDQMQAIIEEERANQAEYLDQLDEQDFRLSSQVLGILSAYGKHIPMRLATAASILIMDEDAPMPWSEDMDEAIEKYQFSPATVFGLENTAVGLMLDLGAGIAFDPTTWIFGPRATGLASRASTVDDALKLADSALGSRTLRDAARIAASDSSGAMALAHNLSYMDEVGILDDALVALNIVDKKIPAGAWRFSEGANLAQEIRLSEVMRMLDPEDLAKLNAVNPQTIDNLTASLANKGFEHPITVTYAVRDGTLHVTDGLKRLRAGQALDLRAIPVQIRGVNTLKREVTTATGGVSSTLEPNSLAAQVILEAAGPFDNVPVAFHGSPMADDVAARIMSGEEKLRGGLARRSERAEMHARNMEMRVAGSRLRKPLPATEGWVFGWRQADLPEELQAILREGRDIEEHIADLPPPMFAYHTSTGLDKLAEAARGALETGEPITVTQGIVNTVKGEVGPAGVPLASIVAKDSRPMFPGRGQFEELVRQGQTPNLQPGRLFPPETVFGAANMETLQALNRQAYLKGAVAPSATRLATAAHFTEDFLGSLRDRPVGAWLERYMTPQMTTTSFPRSGPGAMSGLTETAVRIWGNNTEKLDLWVGRLLQYRRTRRAAELEYLEDIKEAAVMRRGLDAMESTKGGGWDDAARALDDMGPAGPLDDVIAPSRNEMLLREQAAQSALNRSQMLEAYQKLNKQWQDLMHRTTASMRLVKADRTLDNIMQAMLDDYNHTYFGTHPFWKKFKDETGLVPWEEMRRGVPRLNRVPGETPDWSVFSDSLSQELMVSEGIDIGQTLARLGTDVNTPLSINLPMSPYELAIARELGGAAYIRATQVQTAAKVREGAWGFQKWWIIDKVLSPATGTVVSTDELMRFFHSEGAAGVMAWAEGRASYLAARARAIQHGRFSPHRGAAFLKPGGRASRRYRALQNVPEEVVAAETQVYDGIGLGYMDIEIGSPEYVRAARSWVNRWLQESGFRAFLRGPDDFREWFFGADGDAARSMSVYRDGGTSLPKGWEEIYQGWTTVYEKAISRHANSLGRGPELTQALREAAEVIERTGGQTPVKLADSALELLGTVRGVRKYPHSRAGITSMTDWFFEKVMLDPVNFRRGMIADFVRTTERKRLLQLYASQGKTVIPDNALAQHLGTYGVDAHTMDSMRSLLQQQAWDNGYVLESMISQLAETRALAEMDNMLYTWNQGRRFGGQARAAAPFIRPWADMAGFWGREMLQRPTLRGWVNQSNFLNMRNIVDKLPINPKPAAMMSRLAATDFSIDSLSADAGPLPEMGLPFGMQELNLSPMFFLPTGGENPFGALLPGLGVVPLWALDMILPDPLEDPLEYQNQVDAIADFIPGVAYRRGGLQGSVFGGGTTGRAASLLLDTVGYATGKPAYNVTSWMGDITREINRSRELRARLADPEYAEDLSTITDPEELDLALRSLSLESDRAATTGHAARITTRWVAPINARYDDSLEQIHQVWVDASEKFPDLALREPLPEGATDEDIRQAADGVRRRFFELPQWKRDLYIAVQPSLAVNLVGGWEWTALAISQLGQEAATAYRTDGDREALARHEIYVANQFVRPIEPAEQARRILGLQQASREAAAKHVYEFAAEDINDIIWNTIVPEGMRAAFDKAAVEMGAEQGFETGREIWETWGRSEELMEQHLGQTIALQEKYRAWSQTWPGLNDEELSKRFAGFTFTSYSPVLLELANGLGMDITPGMTGLQLFTEVQDVITQVDTPLYGMVRSSYRAMTGERSVASTEMETLLRSQAFNPDLDPDWRQTITDFLNFVERIEDRSRGQSAELRDITLSEQEEVARRFGALRATSRDLPIAWDQIWKDRFQRSFGPLDWVPPTPPPVTLEDGTINPNAYQPYIQRVVDGDTLWVSEANRPVRPGTAEFLEDPNARYRMHSVRLLGVRAAEMNQSEGLTDLRKLQDALDEAVRTGEQIWLVRDPNTYGSNTDHFGRELAYLYIGDTPWYFEESFRRDDTPSGER